MEGRRGGCSGCCAAESKRAAAAARIRGANFNELAVNNGFKLEAADPMDQWDHDKLFCTACCYWSKKRGQQEPQPITCNSALSKIKGRVIKHQNSAVHKLSSSAWAAEVERRRAAHDTGMILGRAAYYQLREGGSYLGFERLVQLQDMNGVDVGNLNHSEKFCRDLLPHFAACITKDISKFLSTGQELLGGELPVVALNADKATIKQRCGHIIGALMIDPASGEIIGIMLADPVVAEGDSDAAGLAGAILKAVQTFVPDLETFQQQVSGFAFDGQYIVGGVPKQLWDALSNGKQDWLAIQWDGAHKLECAMRDVRENKVGTVNLHDVDFYAPFLEEDISSIVGTFRMGKAGEVLRRLVDEANAGEEPENKIRLLSAKIFSDTRFCASEQTVYTNLLRNYTTYVQYFALKAGTGPKRSKDESEALVNEVEQTEVPGLRV